MNIVILTFNYGTAGKYVNGPGMCLFNFVNILKQNGQAVSVFSKLKSNYLNINNLNDFLKVKKHIDRADVVIHWSGLLDEFSSLCYYAKKKGKKVIVGPNVIDCVELDKEKKYLKKMAYHMILTVNHMLRFKIAKTHNIPLFRVGILRVGPDLDKWHFDGEKNNEILWKGNSRHMVKDVNFALDISKKLSGKYKFNFIGYPMPYEYESHIEKAKKSKVYISTSLSETMGLSAAEQLACGTPIIIHPKIHLLDKNYEAGIITNRTVNDYCEAIEFLMEDQDLYEKLSKGAISFSEREFSSYKIYGKFLNFLKKIEEMF